jgi:integrase
MAKRRPSGDGALFQRADGMWVGSVEIHTEDGKRRQKRVYAAKHSVCKKKLKILIDDIESGFIPVSGSATLATWLPHWLDTIHGPTVRPKTKQFYAAAIRLHILPAIGSKKLKDLTPEHVRAMLRSVESSRNKQAAYQTLQLGLKQAMVDGMVKRNVCEAVAKPGHTTVTREAFTVDEAKQIIRTAVQIEASRYETPGEPALATRYAAAFLSGARKAELLGLEWSRVDLDNGVMDLSWQLQQLTKAHGCGGTCGKTRPSACPQAHWNFESGYEWRECHGSMVWTRPKTSSGVRIVPLIPAMVKLLELHSQIIEPNPHGLVWHHPDGRPISEKDDHTHWQHLLKAAGITGEGETLPIHAARHSTATMLQAHGVPEEVRMQIMGQSSVAAHRGYVHVDQTQTRAALAHLNELLA